MRQTRGKKNRTWRLHFVLWAAFALFAAVIIVLLELVLLALVGRQYLEQERENLRAAGEEILASITAGGDAGEISSAAYRYSVGGAYLVYEDDRSVVTYAGETRTWQAFDGLSHALSGESGFIPTDSEIYYGQSLTLGGRSCTLYLSVSLEPLTSYRANFGIFSIVASLSAVVLAFVASGVLSALIARPVVEVTEQAKELARGNYTLNVRKDYFFSEISQLSDALDGAQEEISKSARLQRELIANVSHDFKTPLTMIKGYASMIREISGDDKEKRDAHAQIILDEADRLALLVEDLLDLSRLQAEADEDRRTLFNLSEELHAIVGRFDYLKETQGYKFEVCVEEDFYIRADRTRIGQVMYNLIGNAVNYTGTDKRVRIKLFRSGERARLEVIDSGKGIPADEVDTIWDRYYRSSGTHKRPVQGTGLGLSIVKSVLLAHGIPFGVVSEVGKGSCFWAEFSLANEGGRGDTV